MGRGGAYAASQTSVAYEETQSNRVSDFRDFVCSLFPKAVFFDLYFPFRIDLYVFRGRQKLCWQNFIPECVSISLNAAVVKNTNRTQ